MINKEKQSKYALLMKILDIATKEEFYFEAILIEYAILEDRFSSILRHAKKKQPRGIQEKMNIILQESIFQDENVKKHLTKKLMKDIDCWRKSRNQIIHNLVEVTYDAKEIKDIALQGECLAKRLANKSTLVNRYLDSIE